MEDQSAVRGPVFSSLASDRLMADLVREFVAELPIRAAHLRTAAAEDPNRLRTLAHQLKGAAGGYGFHVITDAAGALEAALAAGAGDPTVQAHVDHLLDLMRRASDQPAPD